MTKNEFLSELRSRLSGIPEKDIEDRLGFYSEMIDDRMEEGLSEEDAVKGIGSVCEISESIISEMSQIKEEKRERKKRFKTWEIVLLAVGSPVWVSLAIAAVAVIFSLYVSLWSVVISLWAVFASFVAVAAASVVIFAVEAIYGNVLAGLAMLGCGFVLAGTAIFLFFGCNWATKRTAILAKKIVIWIKRIFVKEESAK